MAVKLAVAVRTDLDMGRGKIAAQVAHAAVAATLASLGTADLGAWLAEGQPKVVLRVRTAGQLEDLVRQWRRTIEPEKRKAISADMQRLIAEQLYWVNATGYPFFQARSNKVKDYPFYNRAYLFLETTWLDK